MNQLIILDYSTAKVHLYKVDPKVTVDEEYVLSLGFREQDIEWIAGKLQVIKHKGILL
jgi:hypothetical protein